MGSLNLSARDIDSNPRIFGGRIDIGAFESSGLVNIGETLPAKDLVFYPNPSTGKFRVIIPDPLPASGSLQLEVVNILGKTVFRTEYPGEIYLIEIDLSGQPKGIYLVKTRYQGKTNLSKVLIR